VNRGEAIGIIGPSGSGKSTLIQLLLRLRQPDAGQYYLDDINASAVDDETWFNQIAFVPQDSRLINDTIASNIAFFRESVTMDEIERAARRSHIHDEIMAMPGGYNMVLGSRGGALSGGQRQRISIARALLRNPSILVLDEPTSALDMRSESLVHETFTELRGEVTIFVIAHRLSTLNTCDRIMVMGDGQLQAFGSRQELEDNSGFYRDALKLSRIRISDASARDNDGGN
jgi:ABC-type multidrug transport system fused ATPase/permease subunit